MHSFTCPKLFKNTAHISIMWHNKNFTRILSIYKNNAPYSQTFICSNGLCWIFRANNWHQGKRIDLLSFLHQ